MTNKEKYFAPIHCIDCPNTLDALANLRKPSMKSVKNTSKKTYLCMTHANIRGYNTNKQFICLEDYVKEQKKQRDLTEPKKQNIQTDLDNWC